LGDELVAGQRIVHRNGWPDVDLLELGHAWDDSVPSGAALDCAEVLAALITTSYP
jgi:hypothetical protein